MRKRACLICDADLTDATGVKVFESGAGLDQFKSTEELLCVRHATNGLNNTFKPARLAELRAARDTRLGMD